MANHHGMKELSGIHAYCHHGYRRQSSDRFGRLFELAPLYLAPADLKALGDQGGPMDGGTTSKRTKTVPVGHIIFGQFVDHDITLDVTSSLSSVADPAAIPNTRTPTLDLDCIYGLGPEAHPYLYHATGSFAGIKLLTGADGTAAVGQSQTHASNDLTRSSNGTAIIGDPRNDENRIVSQLQLAMIRFHNNVVESLSAQINSPTGSELYKKARETVTWHYQWIVIQDYLKKICGGAVVADILGNGRKYYCAMNDEVYIPVEFSVAAYRFGHSMIPQKIQIQKGRPSLELFGPLLGNGFSPLSSDKAVVDWNELVETVAAQNVQLAEKLDSKMATDLLKLPFIPASDIQSLATRNLLRGQAFLLPSGENVARAMGREEVEINKISQAAQLIAGQSADLSSGTPLWFYLLVEAEKIGRETHAGHFDKGEGLGPVGARIVAETLIGLIELDSRSFLGNNRNWDPVQGVGVSTLGEMLTYQP